MGQFIDSIKTVKQNYKKYDNWEQAQADERAQKEYLSKMLTIPEDKVQLTKKKAETVIRATEILDTYSENNCEDMELATGLAAMVPLGLATFFGQSLTNKYIKVKSNGITNKIKTLNSQLTNELGEAAPNANDIKNQITILKKQLDNVSRKYPMYGMLLNTGVGIGLASVLILWGNSKQKEASRIGRFQAKQNDLKDIKNFVVYTPEQIKEAEKIAEKIPDEKEKNAFAKMFSELKALQKDKKGYNEWLASKDPDAIDKLKQLTYTPEQLSKAKEDQELIVDAVKEINIKAEEYSENIENAFDTLGTLYWLIAAPAGWLINSVLKLAKVPGAIRGVISLAVPTLTSISLSTSGTFVQKEAARVGRYVARKDLSANPARLLAYSDDDMKKAENVKAQKQKKSVLQKVSQSFAFLAQYMKDSKEFEEYKKTNHSKQEKMQKAFADINITDQQKKEAENLKKKVFLAFDEIDEMSQRYSEDVEAGSDIVKNIFSQFWSLLSIGGMGMATLAIFKGKFPVSKIANTIINMGFKKDSSIRTNVNEFYNILKQDKELMHKFQKSIVNGNFKLFIESSQAKELLPIYEKFTTEIKTILSGINPAVPETFKGILNNHLKQGIVAKYVRNLFLQGTELYLRSKNDIPLGKLSGYKTLIATGAFTGIPILGTIIAVPYMLNAWLTDIQKKAGKIGIMKAMEKIDDPRIFADAQ